MIVKASANPLVPARAAWVADAMGLLGERGYAVPRLLWRGPLDAGSMWRAEVRLQRWALRFEIAHRRPVPANEALRSVLVAEPSVGPVYRRMFAEAALVSATS